MVFGNVSSVGEERLGYSYRSLVVRADRDRVLAVLRTLRFSGWVGPQEGPDVVVVAEGDQLLVAGGGRDLEDVGLALARPGPVLVVEVVRDRLLALVLLHEDEEPLRYLSEPSVLDTDDMDEPRGQQHAAALARAFGIPAAAATLRDVLAESLDPEHYIESERLGRVLDLLGLPGWLVACWVLPRQVAAGPDRDEVVRLRAGRSGPAGLVLGRATTRARRVRQALARRPDGPRPDGLADGPGEDVLW